MLVNSINEAGFVVDPILGTGPVITPFRPSVKVLVPISASGLLIGRGGSFIRQMSESSGCKIQIAEATGDPFGTRERIITATSGSLGAVVMVLYDILYYTILYYNMLYCA